MKSKKAFYYGSFFLGVSLLFLWVIGGQTLHLKNLSFNRDGGLGANASGQNTSGNTTNKTAGVVRGILSAFTEVSQSETVKDPAEIEALLKEKLGTALSQQIEPVVIPSISAGNLHVVPNTSVNQQTYLRNVANLTRTTYYAGFSQELDIFNATFSNNDATPAQKKIGYEMLIKARDAYKKLASELSKLAVPEREVNKVVVLVNAYYALSAGSDLLAQSFSDPVLSLQGIHTYAQGYLQLKALNQ